MGAPQPPLEVGTNWSERIADFLPMEALFCLEVMSRHLSDIGKARGGTKAELMERPHLLFYNPDGLGHREGYQVDFVPSTPTGEFDLLVHINDLGKHILSGLNDGERDAWANSPQRPIPNSAQVAAGSTQLQIVSA